METPLRFLAIAVFLLSSLNSSAQLQIEYQSANVSNDTIFLCGNSSFNLNSTIVGTTSLPLSWSASTISGIGSLSLNSASATQITLTPSTTNQAFYQVSLTQGTGASITYVAVGIPPTLSSAPSQLCENNGPVLLYNSLNSSQSITASAGGLNVSGSSVYLNPQGLSNGASISITLSEIFTVPGSNSSFICSSNHSITITKPTSPSISLGSSFLIKCQTAATLNISPSGGNFIIRGPGSSMYSPIATSTILNNGNLNTQNLSIGAGQSLGYFYTDANGCESDTAFVTFGVVEPNVGVQAFSAGTYSTVPQSGGVYTWCGNYTSQLFKLNLPNSSNFPTYDIDWGDGISSTGNTNTSNGATHTYSVAGLYDVILTLYNASGCSVTKNLAIFYGTTPPVDLGNPGSLTGCYDGTNGISLFFPINYPLDLPIGLQMTFSSNDGSTPITVTTPLIDTSVSPPTTAHPNIIDSSNGNLYYKHTFYDGSCGFNSTLGTVYPNSFYVSAVCVSPCGTGADPVGPIYISESPTAGINGPSETCTQTNETFTDNSTSGNAISLNGTTCNTVTKGVWKIFPSTYTVNSGTLGSTPSQSYISDLGYWTTGSNSINVQFNQAGTYTVRRIIGLTSSNDPLCTIDSVDHIICVDTVPIASLLLALPDTSCVSNMLNTSMNLDSINCSEVSKYQFSVYDSTYTSLIYQSSNSTNTNFSWTPSSKGTYVIEYSASNSCGVNSLLDTIVIFDASFNINLNSCAPWSPIISHVINGDNLSYSWTITPNGTFTSLATLTNANTNSPSLSFADLQYPQADQDYTLTLTVTSSDGCTDTYAQTLTLYARPNADFTVPADACGPVTLAPSAGTDYGSNGTINAWSWSVTDGGTFSQTSTQQNPSFTLPASTSGSVTYTVQQTVTDDRGCDDTVIETFTILPTPTASFTLPTDVCTGTNINTVLTDSSTPNDGTTTLNYSWTITDPSGTAVHTSNLTVPNYVLLNTTNAAITYTVNLTVTNTDGCTATLSTTIIVYPDAIAQINTTAIAGCAPLTVTASDLFATTYTTNDTYTWTITDAAGNPVTTTPATLTGATGFNHTVTAVNTTLTVTLTVSSAHGCNSATATATITTYDDPDPSWTLTSNAGCNPFTPTVATVAATNPALTHSWDVFDATGTQVGTTLTGLNPTLPTLSNTSNTTDATYTITHTVSDQSGCSDSQDLTVTVYPTPSADFTMTTAGCAAWTPVISDISVGKTGLLYSWSITPNGTFTSQATLTGETTSTPALTFSALQYPQADQDYTLTLTVTSSDGCTDTYAQTLTLYARPNADFTVPADACGPVTLSPSAGTDYGSNGTINAWSWSVTDGGTFSQTSTQQNPSFTLPASTSGSVTYTVQQTVTDDRGCDDTVIETFTILPTPTASFTLPTDVCTGTNINTVLTDSSTPNDGTTTLNYSWTITDPSGTAVHTSNLTVPNYVLLNTTNAAITYTVNLTVTNTDGCTATLSTTIIVYPDAVVDLVTSTLFDCAPFTIDSTVVSAVHYAVNNSYLWSVKNTAGTVLSTFNGRNNLNHNISASEDSVWVVLQVTSLHGCLDNKDSVLVYTLPNPNPYFDLAADTGCTAFNPIIDSIGQSTGLHVWEVFDSSNNQIGTTLVGNAPVLPTLLNNNTSGLSTYTITHTVFATDSSSCDSSYTQNVYVHPLSIPTINSIGVFCGFDTIPLSATSTNNANVSQWTWTIGSDTLLGQNINYYNPTPGTYGISLTTTTLAGCDTTIYDSLTIHSYPVADISISDCGVDTVCLNQSFNFFDASSTSAFGGNIISFAWDFDDNGSIDYTTQNGSHSYSSTGLKSLRLTVTTQYGCIDDTLINIYVNAPPVNSFEIIDSALCGPTTFNISESDTGIVDSSYYELFTFNGSTKILIQSWNSLPNPLPTLQPNYIADTVYYLSREIFNCCGSDYIEDSIIIRTPPVADFVILPDTGCTPLNTIIQIDGLIKGQADSAYFDFGDGSNTSILPTKIQQGSSFVYQWGQLNHVFTYGGTLDTTYYVTLTVFNDCGDSSLTLPVYVEPNTVQAAFGMDKSSGCSPLTVNFTNYSYNTTNTAWCFDWDVATNTCNGGGSVNQNPTWTFTQPGTYTVALLVDNGCGYDTAFQNVTVFPSPIAVISSNNNVCANDSVNFISNSTTSAGFIAGHLWEFGNGDTSILQNVDYLYDTSGVYTVTLTVTSSTGCSDSTSAIINIRPTPEVNFTTQNVCLNDTTFFENLTTLSNGQIIGNAWNFGDGNSSNAFEPYHIYNAPGTYQVTLTHTSDYGCIDSSQQIAIVHDLPQLSFTPSLINGDSCSVPQTYLFTNNSTNAIQYNWDFDYANNPGVNTSTLTNPNFNYTSPGIYTVALFAETAFGCIDSLFTNILVRDGVNARHVINPTEGCEPLDVTFADTSIYTSSLDTIVSVEWFFGNGNSFIQTTAPFVYNYRYDNYGTYVVYNVVTMASGCLDTSAQTTINVYPTPDADFTISQVNIDTRTFVNLTSFVDSSITYYWTFSDGQTSTDISPTIRFEPSTSGLDSIKACLYVVNSFGCADSICKSFWVWPTNLIVPNAFAPDLNYIGEDALFLPKGHSLKEYEIWIYDQWGSLVWYSNEIDPDIKSPAEGWDGKHMDSGEPLPMGVYAWRIRALFDNNEFWTGQDNTHGFQKAYGTLTLIR
ncbi:PKD domain-containing protein [Schleiferiaceae bacterium]|nr:PKD domain-containing protein [Schleiferiaceae bacterium]